MTTPRGKTRPVPVYKAQDANDRCVGWTFNAVGLGFSGGPIELVVCVDAGFEKIAGFDVLVSTETVGYGDKMKEGEFRDQFVGAPAGQLTLSVTGDREKIDAEIISISGATISSEAVVDAMNDAATQIKAALQKKGLISNGK
jgi:electron transport complex protein RnfG